MSQAPRDISKVLQLLRQAFFCGREFQSNMRFEGFSTAKRTQPEPYIPPGVSHKLYKNYYYDRDARRVSRPPEAIEVTPQLSNPNNLKLNA